MINNFALAVRSVVLFFAILLYSDFSLAQKGIGAKLGVVNPLGDFGMQFKKAPAVDFYFAKEHNDGVVLNRMGVQYVNFRPRLDSFPVFMVKQEYNETILPGYIVWKQFHMLGVYVDYDFRLAKIGPVSVYIGPGLTIGTVAYSYNRSYKTVLNESGFNADVFAGFRSNFLLNCTINDKLHVSAEAMYGAMANTDWALRMAHYNLTLGITYYLNDDE